MFPRWASSQPQTNMDQLYNMQKQNFHHTPNANPFSNNNIYPKNINQKNMFTNVFMNVTHHPFQRTFASVVSCGNPTLMNNSHTNKNTPLDINSLLSSVIYQQSSPQTLSSLGKKEFQDYQSMPSFVHNTSPPPPSQSQPQQQQFHNHRSKYSWSNFHNNYQTSEKPQGNGGRNCRFQAFNRKFQQGFRCRNQNKERQQQQQQQSHKQFHHYDANKNRHERERSSIERDIKNDSCDISNKNGKTRFYQKFNQFRPKFDNNKKIKNNNTNPPFEIYSMEEFPAIIKSISSRDDKLSSSSVNSSNACASTTKNENKGDEKRNVDVDIDETDYVKFQNDITLTTPSTSYVNPFGRRFNLCEKVTQIVKSPQKLLNLPLGVPKRSCLKSTQRNRSISECSDDYIVFDYTTCFTKDNDNDGSTSKFEIDDDDDDDDDDICDENEEEDCEEEEEEEDYDSENETDEENETALEGEDRWKTQKDGIITDTQQPDSGIEERKVHFNLKPKVHVIRAWDFAYRQARKGRCWLENSVDRHRFGKRIPGFEEILNPILTEDHRNRVFNERFK